MLPGPFFLWFAPAKAPEEAGTIAGWLAGVPRAGGRRPGQAMGARAPMSEALRAYPTVIRFTGRATVSGWGMARHAAGVKPVSRLKAR